MSSSLVPVSATFTQLDYSLVGYNGAATFSLSDAGGAPVIGGARTEITTLGSGSLIEGALSFQPGPTGLTIVGTAVNTIANVPPSFSRDQFLGFDVTFVHPPNEYAFLPEGGLVIPGGGSSSTATIRTRRGGAGEIIEGSAAVSATATDVPEPATAMVVGAGLLGLGLVRRRSGPAA